MGTKEGKARVSGRIKVLAFDKGNDGWGEKKGSWMVRLSWVDKKSMSFGMYGSDYLYSTLSDLFSKHAFRPFFKSLRVWYREAESSKFQCEFVVALDWMIMFLPLQIL